MKEPLIISKLMNDLLSSTTFSFQGKGQGLLAPTNQGVYIIIAPNEQVLLVGRTTGRQAGINGRLKDHIGNRSSFSRDFLKSNGNILRMGYKFKYIEVTDPRQRALLEAPLTGTLCPAHIGTSEKKTRNER